MNFHLPAKLTELHQRMTITARLSLGVTLSLLAGLVLSLFAFSADQRSFTEHQLNTVGRIILKQTAASSATLLLAGDQLSLTINLQQLADLPQISGAEITDPSGKSLIKTGRPSDLFIQQGINSEATRLGLLRIHLNPLSAEYGLAQSLPLTFAASLTTLLLLGIALGLFSRRLQRSLRPIQLAANQLQQQLPMTFIKTTDQDELGQIATSLNQCFADSSATENQEPEGPNSVDPNTANTSASAPTVDDLTTASTNSNLIFSEPDSASTSPLIDTAAPIGNQPEPLYSANSQTDSLYSVNPAEAIAQPASNATPEEQQLNTPIFTSASTATSESPSGLDTLTPGEEFTDTESPDSNPSHWCYLFYANHHVGGSDTLTTSERQQLLVRYRKSLEQVARLYKGELSEDPLGNWCVKFSPLSNDHSHGINALCAAQLFNALYRGINTQAIRSFSPALNIKLVLLCGPTDEVDALAEDALLLSDRIQDNDLITHKRLYQISSLNERLLGKAQYRMHDDDTYLISALNNDYQTLIDRQSEHFLKQHG
ncbi:MAG: hypothetical protein V7707_00805 [Motiliproteus sp.]